MSTTPTTHTKLTAWVGSGGGAWGAFGGGLSEYLYRVEGRRYDLLLGTSTGSLLAPLVGLGEFDRLREAYTSVTQKSIFNVNPFNRKGGLRGLNLVWRTLAGRDTLGETQALRRTIQKFYTPEDHERLRELGIEVQATAMSLSYLDTRSFSNRRCAYQDFVDWMWASATPPVFGSLVNKHGQLWTDGGVREHTPILRALELGATEVDVIIHRPEHLVEKLWWANGWFSVLSQVIKALNVEISLNDVQLAELTAQQQQVTLRCIYLPEKLSENSLVFDQEQMRAWWAEGYERGAELAAQATRYVLCPGESPRRL